MYEETYSFTLVDCSIDLSVTMKKAYVVRLLSIHKHPKNVVRTSETQAIVQVMGTLLSLAALIKEVLLN